MSDAKSPTDTTSSSLQPGSTFHGYTVVRCVGMGGMGAVFEGVHEMLGRRCAIKVLHAKAAEKAEARERFVREARSVAKIRHPNVVDIFDVGLLGEVPYLVMEFLEGESLESALARLDPMDAQRATTVLLPIAAAIAAVHRAGIVHRDIKPDNIFLARDPKGHIVPKLVDFGIAKDLTAPMKGSHHTVVGTPHYMSPEQARGSLGMDARTDQYAFGVMLYQLATGRLPYDADSLLDLMRAIDGGHAVPLRQANPSLPPEFEAVVLRAMARDADDRFPSMIELGRALLPFASERLRSLYGGDFGVARRPSDPAPSVSSELDAMPIGFAADATVASTSTTTTLDKMVGRTSDRPTTAARPGPRTTPQPGDVAASAATATPADPRSPSGERDKPRGVVLAVAALLLVGLGAGAYVLGTADHAPANATVVGATPTSPPAVPSAAPSVGGTVGSAPAVIAPAPTTGTGDASAAVGAAIEPGVEPATERRRTSSRRAPTAASGTPTPSAPSPAIGIRLSR